MSAFPLGFWNDVAVEQQNETTVRDGAKADMTLAMNHEFDASSEHTHRILRMRHAAGEQGIRGIFCHRDAHGRRLTREGAVYRAGLVRATAPFARHPAVFGFQVGGEPDAAVFADACRAVRIHREETPHLCLFFNLLPWHPGVEHRVGFSERSSCLNAYVSASQPPLLGYDCYAQMCLPPDESSGWDMYVHNLREYQAAAQRHGIPWWTTLLAVGPFRYRCPTAIRGRGPQLYRIGWLAQEQPCGWRRRLVRWSPRGYCAGVAVAGDQTERSLPRGGPYARPGSGRPRGIVTDQRTADRVSP